MMYRDPLKIHLQKIRLFERAILKLFDSCNFGPAFYDAQSINARSVIIGAITRTHMAARNRNSYTLKVLSEDLDRVEEALELLIVFLEQRDLKVYKKARHIQRIFLREKTNLDVALHLLME
jgi:hypothetical protein